MFFELYFLTLRKFSMSKKFVNKIFGILSLFMKKHTNMMVKSIFDFEKLVREKDKLLVIFGSPDCEGCHKILLIYPYVLYKVSKIKAVLRFCNITHSKSKCYENIWVVKTPTLRFYEGWKLVDSIEELNDILTYFKKI